MPVWFMLLVGSIIFLVFLMIRSDKKKHSEDQIKEHQRRLTSFIRSVKNAESSDFEEIKKDAVEYFRTLHDHELLRINAEIAVFWDKKMKDDRLIFLDHIRRRALGERAIRF